MRGERDDRYAVVFIQCTYLLNALDTGHARHLDVHKDQIKGRLLILEWRLATIGIFLSLLHLGQVLTVSLDRLKPTERSGHPNPKFTQ